MFIQHWYLFTGYIWVTRLSSRAFLFPKTTSENIFIMNFDGQTYSVFIATSYPFITSSAKMMYFPIQKQIKRATFNMHPKGFLSELNTNMTEKQNNTHNSIQASKYIVLWMQNIEMCHILRVLSTRFTWNYQRDISPLNVTNHCLFRWNHEKLHTNKWRSDVRIFFSV